jgi:hypothetical protein
MPKLQTILFVLFVLLAQSLFSAKTHAQPMQPTAAPRIGVLTMQSGDAFWERFGHNALIVHYPDQSEPISYNFGSFDLAEPGFVGKFIAGKMRYQLVAVPLSRDLAVYEQRGRGVSLQWLNLDEAQARQLAMDLAENAKPENARYTYDYFKSNCSTKVRDALNKVMSGALKKQLEGRSQGNTYRSESVRLAWPAKWMALGFHVGMSANTDQPLSRWEEAFIPMRLQDSLREIKNGSQPLVSSESVLLAQRVILPPTEMPRWKNIAFMLGLSLCILVFVMHKYVPRGLALFAAGFWIISGLLGSVMVLLWLFTEHWAGHANLNVLLLSPISLLLIPDAIRLLRGKTTSAGFRALLLLQTALAALAGFLLFFPFIKQEAIEWVLILLPLHWALLRCYAPKEQTA